MRILYMTQWFDPEPAFKGLSFATALKKHGHGVRVVTGFPNYPSGRLYPGYSMRLLRRDTMSGICVDRIPLYPSHDQSVLRRVLNYASFAVSLTIYGLIHAHRHDLIYVYHPPITTAFAAAIVGLIARRPFVLDVQDLWPDTLAATSMVKSRFLFWLAGACCRFVYRRAAHIIVQSPGFQRALVARGAASNKITVIVNWAEEDDVTPRGRHDLAPYALSGKFSFIFAGTLGLAQDLDTVLDAAKKVAGEEPRISFVIIGDGVEKDRLSARIEKEQIGNVRLLPRIERCDIADVLSAGHVLLVTLKADPLFEITIPSKTQFCLAIGKPILMGLKGDAARLVLDCGAGVTVEPGDPSALAAAAIALARSAPEELRKMGQRGAAYYRQELSFAAGVKRTLAVLEGASQRP